MMSTHEPLGKQQDPVGSQVAGPHAVPKPLKKPGWSSSSQVNVRSGSHKLLHVSIERSSQPPAHKQHAPKQGSLVQLAPTMNVPNRRSSHAVWVVSKHVPLSKQHEPSTHESSTHEVPRPWKEPPISAHERPETTSQPTGLVQHAPAQGSVEQTEPKPMKKPP